MSTYQLEGPEATSDRYNTTYLQYPSNLGSEVNNWVSFEAFDFKNGNNQTLDIALYLPGDGLTTSYKSEYEDVSLGVGGAVAQRSADKIAQLASGDLKSRGKGLKGVIDNVTGAIQSESAGKRFLAIKAGAALGGMGSAVGLTAESGKAIMEHKMGAVVNPHIIAAYKGPTGLRNHEFSFQMMPQSEQESKTCVQITSEFKKAMLPSHIGGNSVEAPSMLFGYPDQFLISYTVNGTRLPNGPSNPLFNIGRSVLTDCTVDFATESVPLFFEDTQHPASISMKLTFMELEMMHRGKINKGF